mgnify:CR=1 FL=1|tara:strand:- start:87045 stop:88142 length:1098 start_codon:yes stop_codon:yes gene_type:complete
MKINILSAIVASSLLSGCVATTATEVSQEQNSSNYHVLESKKRTYPIHLRNGVVVKQTQTWHLGEGRSFASTDGRVQQPIIQQAWTDSDEGKAESDVQDKVQLNLEIYRDKPVKNTSEEQTEVVSTGKTETSTEADVDSEGTDIERRPVLSTNDAETIPEQNCDIEFGLSKDDVEQLTFSKILPNEHNQTFKFISSTTTLTDESRERLIHFAPQMLIFKNIKISAFYGSGGSAEDAWIKASSLKRELIRAGVKRKHIDLEVNPGNPEEVVMDASDKLSVSFGEVEFREHNEIIVKESLDDYLSNIVPSKVEWIRLLAGNEHGHPLSKALAVKAKLKEHGVSSEKITILHRNMPSNNVKSLIYLSN